MVKTTIHYEGALRCVAEHGPSGSTVETDAPTDNCGRGERFSPTDLCAVALGSCIATTIGIKCTDLELDLRGMRVEVEKHMSANAPRRIAKLVTTITVPPGITDPKTRATLERIATSCPVHQSLHPEIEKPIAWIWE